MRWRCQRQPLNWASFYDFLVRRDPVFVNGFSVSSSLYALKMSAVAVELGFLDDFWVPSDPVFNNGFWASSSLYALKMSVWAV